MQNQLSAIWVIRKVDFLKVVRDSSRQNFYNAVVVCSIFCTFKVCTMHSKDYSLLVAVKVNLLRVSEDTSNHRFYNACVVSSIFCTF